MKPRAINLGTMEPEPPQLVGVMVLLDRSGSMAIIKKPMEVAFNEFVAQQRALNPDGMWLSLYQFDSYGEAPTVEATFERKALADVPPLVIRPRGDTPLRDALYEFAGRAREIVDDPNDPTERLLLVMITDGGENSSHRYTWTQVKETLQGLESADCESLWLGTTAAIMDVASHVETFQQPGSTVSYQHTAAGAHYAAHGLHTATASMRSGGSARAASATYTATHATDEGAAPAWDDEWTKQGKAWADVLSGKTGR